MTADEVEELLRQGLPDCELQVTGGDNHFEIIAIGHCFDGLSAVRRQQTVYAALGDAISSGRIHAVNIRTLTPGEGGDGP